MVMSVFRIVGTDTEASMEIEQREEDCVRRRRRRISITQFKSLCENRGGEEGAREGE